MAYKIEVTAAARRALKKLDSDTARRIGEAIDGLAVDPRPAGVKKLAGADDLYRIRVRDYRIIYQIEDKQLLIVVVTIGNRREVYRRRLR
jgi:mRNA interferase RelE/StbE